MSETKAKHYPSTRYHPDAAPVIVRDAAHEDEVAHPDAGWVETPADFPPPAPPDPTRCAACGQKLADAKKKKG